LALLLAVVPDGLALAAEGDVVFGAQEDEVVDDLRGHVEGGELDFQVARLARAAAEVEADADFPGLAVLADPVGDADDAVGGVVAEGPFGDDVGQTPRADLDAVLETGVQEGA